MEAQIPFLLSLSVTLGGEILRIRRDSGSVASRLTFLWIHRDLEHLDKH